MMVSIPFPWRFEGSRYPDHYLMSQVTEAQVQANILSMLAIYKVDAIPIDAGGRRQRGRMIGAAKKAGVDLSKISNRKTWYSIPSGFSDIEATLAPRGRALYIEVKAPAWVDPNRKTIRQPGLPSAEQLEFLMEKHRRGAIVMVAWSEEDVSNLIGDLLVENHRAIT